MRRVEPWVALLLFVLCPRAGAAPMIQDISPAHASFGAPQPVAITGTGFQAGARMTLQRGGPHLLGSAGTFSSQHVVASGSYAYVAGTQGVKVVDVSDPAAPKIVGSLSVRDANDIAIAGSRIYVTNGDRLVIGDISNPTAPRRLGSFDCGYAETVAVSGKRAYVADRERGLLTLDVSKPSAPRLLGRCAAVKHTSGLAVAGNLVYAADAVEGLVVVDVSMPSTPRVVGQFNDKDGAFWDVALAGNYAYVAGEWLMVIDISDARAPVRVADPPVAAFRLTAAGQYLYVASHGGGLEIVDVTNPVVPIIVGSALVPGYAWGVAVDGTTAYVADLEGMLLVFDVSLAVTPLLPPGTKSPGSAAGVAVAGDRAFVADGDVQVFDLSNPLAPAHRKSLATPGWAQSVTLAGTMALVADGDAGLTVVDISNPNEPAMLGTVDTPGTATQAALSGSHAYVADLAGGLQVVDLADPAAPANAGSYTGVSEVRSVCVASGNLVLATYHSSTIIAEEGGLLVLDVSVPTAPVEVARLAIPASQVWGVAVVGAFAYMADAWNGLHIVDISTPTNPRIVGALKPPRQRDAGSISVVDGYAYLSGWLSLMVIDVSRPTAPRLLEEFPMAASDVAAAGNLLFVAARSDGLRAVPLPAVMDAAVVDATRIEAQIPAGRYPGRYHVRVLNPDGTEASLLNAFEVDGAALRVSAHSFDFGAWREYLNPAPVTLGIVNTGNSAMTWTAVSDAAWLTVAPGAGDGAGIASVSIDIAGLEPGLHTATITVASAEAANGPLTVPVTLRILDPAVPLLAEDFTDGIDIDFSFLMQGRWSFVDGWAKSLSTTGANRLVLLEEVPVGGRIEVDIKLGRGGLTAANASVAFGSLGKRPRYVKLTTKSLTIGGKGELPVVTPGVFQRGVAYHLRIDAYPDGRVSAFLSEGGNPVAQANAVFAPPAEGFVELKVAQAVSFFDNLSVYHPSILP